MFYRDAQKKSIAKQLTVAKKRTKGLYYYMVWKPVL